MTRRVGVAALQKPLATGQEPTPSVRILAQDPTPVLIGLTVVGISLMTMPARKKMRALAFSAQGVLLDQEAVLEQEHVRIWELVRKLVRIPA